jgi:O-succinylbenzoic acid--CoA ligase
MTPDSPHEQAQPPGTAAPVPAGTRPCVPTSVPPGPPGVAVLLPALVGALAGTGPAIAPLPAAGPHDYARRLAAAVRPEHPVPDDVAIVAATSGSTGDPSGVLLPASALRAAAEGFAARFGRHRWVATLPLHHAGGLMVAVRSVLDGTTPVAVPSLGGAARFSLEGFAEATGAARAGREDDLPLAVSLVPAMLATLAADDAGTDLLRQYDVVLVGGAAAPAALVSALRRADVRLVLSYGMTETCGGVAFDGMPLPGASVAVGPDQHLVACGAQVAGGYRDGRDPDRWSTTADGTRCFRTDDLGRVDPDGRVQVLGRADDVVQVAGSSVSLGAIAALLREDTEVGDAEVVAVPDARYGARIVAYVVPTARAGVAPGDPDPAGLAARLGQGVAAALGRAARPRAIRVVEAMPLLDSGKPDRRRLAALAQGAPD